MNNRSPLVLIHFIVMVLLFSSLVFTKEDSAIKKVTVYPDRAMITRDLTADVTPGRQAILFSNLPPTLDKRSIRVSGKGSASVKILDVQVKTEFLSQISREDIRKMEQHIQQIDKQISSLADRNYVLDKSEKFLELLMSKTLESIGRDKNPQTLSLDKYKQMSLLLEEQLNRISGEKRKIAWEKSDLEEQKENIRKEMNLRPESTQKERLNVSVEVDVKKAGQLTLSLSYIAPGAGWTPAYDLYISTAQEKDSLTYSAYVAQQTGEDWLDSLLTLSTAKPMESSSLPSLNPIFLDLMNIGTGMISGKCVLEDGSEIPGTLVEITGDKIKKRSTVTNEKGYFQVDNLPDGVFNVYAKLEGFNSFNRTGVQVRDGKITIVDIMLRTASLREEITFTGKTPIIDRDNRVMEQEALPEPPKQLIQALTETATAKLGDLATTFSVPYPNTVNSGIETKKVTLLSDSIPIEKEYISAPARSNNVILKARVKNTLDAPLIAGPANIFVDGSFVNSAFIRFLNPGESFEIPLGVDQAITVKCEPLEKESTVQGFFKKTTNIPLGYRITIKNMKNFPVKVKILDQIPVSKNEKVKVKVEEIKPTPEKAEPSDQEKGFMTWYLTVEPGQEKVILVKYTLSYPKNSVLDEGI